MTPHLWTPGYDQPPGALAGEYLRRERRRERQRWRHVRDPRVDRTLDLAVTVRSKSSPLATGTGTSATATEPAGATNGDMLVALALCGAVISQPSGWTQLFKDTQGAVSWVVSYIARGGAAPSLAWTWTGSAYYELHVICLKPGVNAVTFDSVSAAGAKGNAAAHDPNPPATVSVKTTSLAIAGGINFGGSNVAWSHATYTIETDNAAGRDGVMGSKALAAAGSEDPAAFTGEVAGNQDYWDGFTATFTDEVGTRRFLMGRH